MDFNLIWKLVQRDTDISEHLLILFALVVGSNAKTIVEIGAGQSTFVLTTAADITNGEFYSIDLTKQARERLFPEAPNLDLEPKYHFVGGNSIDTKDTSGVKWDKPIDFLFIDSGHTYDLTIGELKKFTPFVKPGGFVCMHDTGINNIVWAECRKAMLDFSNNTNWEKKQLDNQNGLTILRKR